LLQLSQIANLLVVIFPPSTRLDGLEIISKNVSKNMTNPKDEWLREAQPLINKQSAAFG
jgi:hypothetical protein